jgi:hypothetical protein
MLELAVIVIGIYCAARVLGVLCAGAVQGRADAREINRIRQEQESRRNAAMLDYVQRRRRK